jgi:molybdopterin synthase catalytic subunit
MARIKVQTQDFNVSAELAALTAERTDIGGIGCFIGTVRDNPGPGTAPSDASSGSRPVAALTLEHYPAMTERAIARITGEAERRWSLLGCTVIHRVGRLYAGDNIVLVLAAAAHRQPALEATAFLIDWLKTKAPFWKREEFPDGTSAWVEAKLADDTAAARW